MQETSKILRTDTVALFERLREGNILLQEVLTGAHDNLNSLERALVTRVADFVSAMNDVTSRNGAATQTLEDQLTVFNDKTGKALEDLGSLSSQFELPWQSAGRGRGCRRAEQPQYHRLACRTQATLELLVTAIDLRTADLDQRLSRFTGLLDELLAAAEERARDIARVVAETAGAGSAAISRQFEAVRVAAEQERRQTARYHERAVSAELRGNRRDVQAVGGKVLGDGAVHEADGRGNAQRTRGHPQRTPPWRAGNAAGGRRKHRADAQGDRRPDRGTRRVEPDRGPSRPWARRGEPGPRQRAAPGRARRWRLPADARAIAAAAPPPCRRRTSACPPAGAPKRRRSARSRIGGRDGWLSDLLNRTDATVPPRAAAPRSGAGDNPLASLSLDIGRLMDRNLAAEMWDRYQRGESKAFTKRLYTPAGQKAFDEVARKYRADRGFKQTVDRYITEFERLLDEVAREDRGPQALRGHLTSETGMVYTLLAHAAGRLG